MLAFDFIIYKLVEIIPFLTVNRLQCILRGIKIIQVNLSKPCLPIDRRILSQICCLLRGGLFSPAIDKTFECMCLLGFNGFLGCAEINVRCHRAMLTLFLAESKTDPFRRGTTVLYFQNDTLCPVSCMKSYLEMVMRESFDSNGPLFVDCNNKPFSRENFISYLRDILRCL